MGWLAVPFRMVFATVDVSYRTDRPGPGPMIYIANHRSFFDIPVGLEFFMRHGITPQVAVHRRFFSVRPLAWLLRRCGGVPLASGMGDAWIAGAAAELQAGRPVALMPQGRMATDDDQRSGEVRMRSGVSRLAQASGVPIVPIGALGTDVVWPLGRPLPRRGLHRRAVQVRVGEAIAPPTSDVDDLADYTSGLTDAIVELLAD